jgi:hypothetical protein
MPRKPPSPATAREIAKAPKLRVFKTEWFAKAAGKRGIADDELCKTMAEVMEGKADSLGGGVWKKRLNDNMDRSIIAAKGALNWIFVFLYSKKDRENIAQAEEDVFKKLAGEYALLTPEKIAALLQSKKFVEICHERS